MALSGPLPDDGMYARPSLGLNAPVHTGNQSGFALALDAATGEELWRYRLGAGVRSQPIAYEVDGRVFVAIGAGNGTFVASTGAPEIIPEGGHLFVFELR